MRKSLRELFAETRVYSPKDKYVIVSLGSHVNALSLFSRLRPFSSVTFETDDVSLVIRQTQWNRCSSSFKKATVAGPYRLIAFDVIMSLDVVGFLATVSRLLADAGISIISVSTYLRDYILVSEGNQRKSLAIVHRFLKKQRKLG